MMPLPEYNESEEIRVRAAAPSDAEAVRAIGEETWWAAYRGILEPEEIRQHVATYYALGALRRRIASREAEWLVGEMAGECVGYCSVLVAGRKAEMATLYVLPRVERRGVGRAMVEQAVELAREKGAETVLVNYAVDNGSAARFYAAVGFRETGRHRRGGHGVAMVTAKLGLRQGDAGLFG